MTTLVGDGGNNTLTGTSGDDSLSGLAGNDSLPGGNGNDTLDDGAGNDTLNGGSGNDVLQVSGGSDSVIGSFGTDTLVAFYGASNRNETVTNNNGTGTISDGVGPTLWRVTFNGVENFDITTGSGNDNINLPTVHTGVHAAAGSGNDTITTAAFGDTTPSVGDSIDGGSGNDSIYTGVGDDTIFGGDGADSIYPGGGSDFVDAGDGDDSLVAAEDSNGVSPNDTLIGGSGNDTIDTYLGADSVDGGDGNDRFLNVDDNNPTFPGAETFAGGAGQDSYVIQIFDITYNLPIIPDVITDFATGPGGDVIEATISLGWHDGSNPFLGQYLRLVQDGTDTLFQIDRDGAGHVFSPITILTFQNTVATSFTQDNFAAPFNFDPQAQLVIGPGETIAGTTNSENIAGTNGPDILFGNGGDDTLDGGDNNDLLNGGAGNDCLIGGRDNDTLLAGVGADTIWDYSGANSLDGGDGDDAFLVVGENQAGDPWSTPPPGSDTITGGPGADTYRLGILVPTEQFIDVITDFEAGAGGDVLDIMSAALLFSGYQSGTDPFSGGFVRLVQSGADALLQFDRDGFSANETWFTALILQNEQISSFTAENFEAPFNFSPSGSTAISANGDANANALTGAAGADSLSGNDGNDSLSGSGGNDTLSGDNGNDSLSGDFGDDSLAGGNNDDSLFGSTGNDTLLGGDGSDFIDGSSGNDSADGGLGDDTFVSGSGVDSINGEPGIDQLTVDDSGLWGIPTTATNLTNFNAALGSGAISGNSHLTNFVGIEVFDIKTGWGDSFIDLSGAGSASTILGNAGNDTFIGGNGDDSLNGADGADRLTGGPGRDSFYEGFGFPNYQPGHPDTITDFQTGSGGDVLDLSTYLFWKFLSVGDVNPFAAGELRLIQSGLDTLLQSGGPSNWATEVILKNAVATSFTRENFADPYNPYGPDGIFSNLDEQSNAITGTYDDDTIFGNGGADAINGSLGNDTISGGDGADDLQGGSGSDTILGGDGADFIRGDIGDDQTFKDPDTDSLSGGNGDDTIYANDRADTIFGDAGNDAIHAGIGSDSVDGGDGNDSIEGDSTGSGDFYDDTLLGGNGDDTIDGGGGANLIDGGAGNDRILNVSAPGSNNLFDRITGGAGRDEFSLAPIVFNLPFVLDDIVDFQTGAGGDFLDLVNLLSSPQISGYVTGSDPLQTGYVRFFQSGSDSLFLVDTNGAVGGAVFLTILTLQNTTATSFTVANLLYPGNSNSVSFTAVESTGATVLDSGLNHFYLHDRTNVGPSLKVQGTDVLAGQFGAWTPIAAEKTGSGGYEIAWKFGSADLYTLWAADANGNYSGNLIGNVAGSDATLQSAETLFQQDLNGDGRMGLPATTVMESHGATRLATGGNRFYLQDSNGNGPALSANGANVLAGQFGAWTPIAAEKTSSGYEIAWKSGSADLYTLWATDANGNYSGNLIGNVAGSDATLQSAETLFQQDLNGDGRVGLASVTIIESHGATTLATGGNKFYLQDSGGNGPVLSSNGADVLAGQFGAWTPIAVEKTSSGYEIAWKSGSADLYTLWATDANGHYSGNVIGNVSGADAILQSAETLFQQDLNGDGALGTAIQSTGQPAPIATPIETHGATTLATAGNKFYLQDSGGNGPVLSSNGADVLAGQFGLWTPIAAEKTSSGYEIAWKSGSADLYTLWATDANGHYSGNVIGNVSGADATLRSAETLFQQDINGDGALGTAIQSTGQPAPITTPIESRGATTLATAGNKFYLQDSGGNGPVLSANGADVVAGQFGVWTPIAAEKTSSGYEIAWKSGSADLYTLWATDANGHYTGNVIGNVSGSDPTLELAETLFQQDLNGDTHFGLF